MKFFRNNKIYILIPIFLIITNISYIKSSSNNEESVSCPNGLKCHAKNGECTKYDDENSYFCNCKNGYTTYPIDNEIGCNYEQKKQLKAFLLEFFLCFGSGNFYIHNYKLAVPKLVVFIFFYCLFIVLRIITKAKEENKLANLIICICAGIVLVGMLTWQIIDLVKFGKNQYKDGNGVELKPW